MAKNILGISAFYHDSAAAIISDGVIIAAAHEERFTRKKHDDSFPRQAVIFCLEQSGLPLEQIDAVVFYDKPFLKFERLLETYYAFAPKGLRSFLKAMPVWVKEKLFLKDLLKKELQKIGTFDTKKTKLLFSEHHLSHAASAFYPSPFFEAAILTLDGVGEWATTSISHGKGKNISPLRELDFPHSLGLLYSAFTYYLGFKVNSGEYKLMGLAPYGNPEGAAVKKFKESIYTHLVDVKADGSLHLNQQYFNYAVGLTMTEDAKWKDLFGLDRRLSESELQQEHCDMALAIQQVTEEIVLKLAKTAAALTGSKNLCLAGGVALNCVSNAKILNSGLFEHIWIQPAAGDAGGALGSALAVYHLYYGEERVIKEPDAMQGSYLGPEYSDTNVAGMIRKYGAVAEHFNSFEKLCEIVAKNLSEEQVVGWFQGRMEWGPRALGNRSILGDARSEVMQKRMNLKIKFRESFRPFAPSVLEEDESEYFELSEPSPYMLLVAEVKKQRQNLLPDNYHSLAIREKLYFKRSDVPAITHLDFSARLQTVNKNTNIRYWQLLSAFKKLTGYGIVVNTSFNVRGEPIVCTPEDAYRCFMRTEMDCLVINNYLFTKKSQPVWNEKQQWKEEYVLD